MQLPRPVIVALLALAPAALSAQTAAPATGPVLKLEPYSVTGSRPDDLSSLADKTGVDPRLAAQSFAVVPRAVLDDQKVLTLAEATRNVSGTATDFGFNGSSAPLLILRGFQTTSMTAMGMMSGMSSYYLNGTKVQGIPVNMANVESVQVVKGPDSVLFGRGEPGGLVNVVSRPVSETTRFSLEGTAADTGAYRVIAEGSGPLGTGRALFGRLAASTTRVESDRDFVVENILGLSAGAVWAPDAKTRVSLTVDRVEQEYRNDYGVPALGNRPANLPDSRQFNDAPELSTIDTTSALLEFRRQLNDAWSLKARALTLEADTHEMDISPWRSDLTTGEDRIAVANELARYYYYIRPDGRYRLDQFTLDLTGKFETGSLGHTLLAGFDTYYGRKTGTTYFQQLNSVNIFNPDFSQTPRFDPAMAMPVEYDDHNRWTSVYVNDQVALGHGVHLVGALRYDRTSAIFAAPGTQANKESFVTPRAGLVWEVRPGHVLFAQYQDAVAANNGRNVDGTPLDAETARQVEAGWRYTAPDQRLTTTLSVYELTKSNRTDYSLYPVTIQTIGEARSRGVEWDFLGRVTDELSVIASAAYTEAEVTKDPFYQGTRLANVPRTSGSLWTRYQLAGGWAVGAGVFAQGQRQGDQANTFQLPGYARTDAMLSYDFTAGIARVTLQLNVDNVLDRRFYTGSHQFVKDWIAPGKPRTFTFSARVEY
ncbi:Ferrichrome-iron receptor precursor [Lacunisphaera limnophila]|uniref:Ferrichrome-iron receptor n=1 Tax=Lacunisphaera limnophila TaxID=1838286 RepID=A0A1D8ARJ3_9BACT|nr:TonB-dependent siderophore receptor [Lacunisphaera limnophila]AOS43514.1 Ferrichrome-iron receptor precursor [Lacunisphaera limnophila]